MVRLMKCANCGFDNDADAEFCENCGAALARIDRLSEDVRHTLQVASVIGRSFLYRLLEAVAEADRQLEAHLAELDAVAPVQDKARRTELAYIFKHYLT